MDSAETDRARSALGAPPSPAVLLEADPDPDSPRKWLVFGIVAAALFMASIDVTIVGTAVNAIHRSLGAPLNWTGWTISGFTLGMTVTMPIAGRISDQFGRKQIFIGSVVLFTAASLACGLANDVYVLVALRCVQAIGGGAFMPSATGIVSDHFGANRDRAIAMFTSILPIGGIVGPVLGGLIVGYWSWRGIFFINVPVGVAVVLLGRAVIPHSPRQPDAKADLVGGLLLGLVVLGTMFAITDLGNGHTGVTSPSFVVPLVIAAGLSGVLGRHLRRAESPIIPLQLLRGRGFLSMNLINFLYGCSVLGMGALVPLYAIDRYHLSTIASGTVLTARAVGMISVAGIATFLLRKTGYRLPMVLGFCLIGLGSALLWMRPMGLPVFWWLAFSAAVSGIGMGASMPATNNATLSLAPKHVAVIVGLRGMFRQGGSILAVSVMTTVITRASSPGAALAVGFLVFGALTVALVPLVYTVPEHRGSW